MDRRKFLASTAAGLTYSLAPSLNADGGSPSSTKRRYFLSEDGAHLIELVEAHNGFGDTEQRLVFDK
jgi:hypothetical protein